MRVPNAVHQARALRIHEIVPDFDLEDVWALPTPGDADDFPQLVEVATALDPSRSSSRPVRALFALRWKLGELLGWDEEHTGLDARVGTLRARLPADLRDGPTGPEFPALPFAPLYLTENELAAEIANQTMHGVLHLSWVRDADGDGYHGEMAVYVKRNGLFGTAYMAAIAPFRHLLVYPPMIASVGQAWRARYGNRSSARERTSAAAPGPSASVT